MKNFFIMFMLFCPAASLYTRLLMFHKRAQHWRENKQVTHAGNFLHTSTSSCCRLPSRCVSVLFHFFVLFSAILLRLSPTSEMKFISTLEKVGSASRCRRLLKTYCRLLQEVKVDVHWVRLVIVGGVMTLHQSR